MVPLGLNDQVLPRVILLGWAAMFALGCTVTVWRERPWRPESAPRATSTRHKVLFITLAWVVFGTIGYLVAFKVHWYPATDGT